MAKATKQAEQKPENEQPINIEPAEAGTYEVVQEFRDIMDFSKVHKVGDTIKDMDRQRLAELEEGGLVKKK